MCIINLKSQNILFFSMFLSALSLPAPLTLLPLCYSWGPRFHSGHMFWRRHAYSHAHTHTHTHRRTHIHELVFSLCPYAVSGVVLLLCCSQTGPFTAAPATRLKQSSPHPTPPHRAPPPINYRPPHTHTHTHTMAPLSHKATTAGVLLLAPV